MLRKPWYLIPVIAVACMLTACSVQETVTAPTEVTAVLAEPTEPTQSTATEPVEEVRAQAPADEVPAETEPAQPPAETEHIHDWTETVIAPTCTQQGYTERTCCNCSESRRDTFVAPISHCWSDWQTTVEATETSEGTAERSCCFCAVTESRVLPMLPPSHTHAYTEAVTVQPTCTKMGTVTFTCSCGDRYTNDIPRLSHSYTAETVPATCLLRGYDVFTCGECGDSYKDRYTPATGHSWSSWKTTVASTITSTGLKERTCTGCGAKETEVIEKIPHTHSHTGKVTAPAKCQSDGVKTFTCACGDTYTETLSATGHSWSSWKTAVEATETNAGRKERTCSACKAVETEVIPQLEHSHSMVHIKTKPTCTQEGYTTHKCCKCDYTYVDSKVSATGHTWSQWLTVTPATDLSTGLAKRTCSVCGTQEDKTLPKDPNAHTHSYGIVVEYVEPGCNSDGYQKKACTCGETKTETLPAAHNWQHHHEDEVGHYDAYIVCHCGWRCSAAGDYISRYAGHINSLPADEKWTHSYYETGVWVVDIPAKVWDQCTVCGATK